MYSSSLISVIVPIYNVDQYLDRCIESITQQSYPNLEIILVDDGSPDQCPKLCDDWAIKDQRIKVIHKENGGLSDARNAGLAVATGDYISFVDSDDWLNVEFYKNLLEALIDYECDVVDCDYVSRSELCDENPSSDYQVTTYDRVEAMGRLIDDHIKQTVWNKLYKASVIQGLLFEKGKYHEDVFWSYQAIARIHTFGHISYVGYNYFQRDDSIMGDTYSLKRLDAVEAKVRRQEYLDVNMPELSGKGRVDLIFTCLYHGQCALRYLDRPNQKTALDILKEILKDHKVQIHDLRTITFLNSLWLTMACIAFKKTCLLRNILKVGL